MPTEISDDELVERFAGYQVDHDTAAALRGRMEHRLLVNRCDRCGEWHQPPKPVCPRCWSADVTPTPVRGTGTVFMAIFLHQGPPAEGVGYATPHPVVTVGLDEQPGLRLTATTVGAADDGVHIGDRVELDWIDRGGVPVPAFRPANDGGER